jgi:hypothetical protein
MGRKIGFGIERRRDTVENRRELSGILYRQGRSGAFVPLFPHSFLLTQDRTDNREAISQRVIC